MAESLLELADGLRQESARDQVRDKLIELNDLFDKEPYQSCRVIGNACFDHPVNRQICLDHNYHVKLLALIDSSKPTQIIKVAAGALLNLCMDCPAAQEAVVQAQGIRTFLTALDGKLYLPNSGNGDADASMTTNWLLQILEDLHQEKKFAADFKQQHCPTLPLVKLLVGSQPKIQQITVTTLTKEEVESSAATDRCIILLAAELVEALSLDVDVFRIDLANEAGLPDADSLLDGLMDFLELGQMPAVWSIAGEKDWQMICAAVAKTLCAASSEDDFMEACFESKGPHWAIARLINWLKIGRADLVICASIALANLARNDNSSVALLQDYNLLQVLQPILVDRTSSSRSSNERPGENTQALHGVMSLLKHLAIPSRNKALVAQAEVISAAVTCMRPSFDLAHPLQAVAVGVVKALTGGRTDLTCVYLSQPDALTSITKLAQRSEEARIKSECARTISGLIRAAWASVDMQKGQSVDDNALLAAKKQLEAELVDIAALLTNLITSAAKFPLLINEAVVALTLLTTVGSESAEIVLKNLLQKTPSSEANGDTGTVRPSALEQLLSTITKADTSVPIEIKTNGLALFGVLFNFVPHKAQERSELSGAVKLALSDFVELPQSAITERARQVLELATKD